MGGWFVDRRITIGIAVVLCAFAAVVAVSFRATRSLADSIAVTQHTYEVINLIGDVRTTLAEAESARRGFALTGEASTEQMFHDSATEVMRSVERLTALTSDNDTQQQHLEALDPLLLERMDNLRKGLRLINEDFALNDQRVLTREGIAQAHRVRSLLDAMENVELKLLAERKDDVERQTQATLFLLILGGLFGTVMAGMVLVTLNRQMGAQTMAESQLRLAHGDVSSMLQESEFRNESISFLSELSSMLQACRTSEEVFDIIHESMKRGFPHQSGTLNIHKASRNAVVVRTAWGGWEPAQPEFSPDECWALRRGQIHIGMNDNPGMRCKHVPNDGSAYLCAPLVAQGETQGVLTLKDIGAEWREPERQRYAKTLAESLGMAMANLALRERLLNQAITDPLTGLFNRRYMEETLSRELSRAERSKFPVSVILIDIDHFKQFNDIHSHQAGDEVLRQLGEFLRGNIRSGDFACRYGGEEFALVMADSPIDKAAERAETLRSRAHELQVAFAGRSLGTITLSLGVACAPEHGVTFDQLVRTADSMLYRAKEAGRDRVCVAPSKEESSSGVSRAEGI